MFVTCHGQVVTDVNGVAACQDLGGAPLAWEVVEQFTVEQIDPALASGAFAAGFVLIGTAWALGQGFKVALSLLK